MMSLQRAGGKVNGDSRNENCKHSLRTTNDLTAGRSCLKEPSHRLGSQKLGRSLRSPSYWLSQNASAGVRGRWRRGDRLCKNAMVSPLIWLQPLSMIKWMRLASPYSFVRRHASEARRTALQPAGGRLAMTTASGLPPDYRSFPRRDTSDAASLIRRFVSAELPGHSAAQCPSSQ